MRDIGTPAPYKQLTAAQFEPLQVWNGGNIHQGMYRIVTALLQFEAADRCRPPRVLPSAGCRQRLDRFIDGRGQNIIRPEFHRAFLLKIWWWRFSTGVSPTPAGGDPDRPSWKYMGMLGNFTAKFWGYAWSD